jgi:hypothetical protein
MYLKEMDIEKKIKSLHPTLHPLTKEMSYYFMYFLFFNLYIFASVGMKILGHALRARKWWKILFYFVLFQLSPLSRGIIDKKTVTKHTYVKVKLPLVRSSWKPVFSVFL